MSPMAMRKLESRSESRAHEQKRLTENRSEHRFEHQQHYLDQQRFEQQRFEQQRFEQQRFEQQQQQHYHQMQMQQMQHQQLLHSQNQRFEHESSVASNRTRTRTDSPVFNEMSFYNSSRSPSPTSSSGQRKTPLPIKTPTSMQRVTSVKNQNFQVYQNLGNARYYQSNAELFQSREKLEIPQPDYYREPTPLVLINDKSLSEYDKFMTRQPVNVKSSVQPAKSPLKSPAPSQPAPEPPLVQFKLKKRPENSD